MLNVRPRAERGSWGATRAATSSITVSTPSVFARRVASAPQAISSSRAAVLRTVTVLHRETGPQDLLHLGLGHRRTHSLALRAQLVGDRRRDQIVLGVDWA
jgi:hypothetical protein